MSLNPKMKYSKTGLQLTERFESCRLVAYKDSGGVWTIGWGHTGDDVEEGLRITQGTADALVIRDTQIAVDHVNLYVHVKLTQEEFDALVDFEYNTGALEKSTMLKYINAQQYHKASLEFGKWVHDKAGHVLVGLLRRRKADEELFDESNPLDITEPVEGLDNAKVR